jgi:ABC-type Zn uptake system ZnuABC Zn-binding protein ZnuA
MKFALFFVFIALSLFAGADNVNDRLYTERFEAQEKWMREALQAQDKKVEAAYLAAEKAVNKAEAASEKRFESINEFRAQLKDQQATFITRSEAWGYFVGLAGIIMWGLRRKEIKNNE